MFKCGYSIVFKCGDSTVFKCDDSIILRFSHLFVGLVFCLVRVRLFVFFYILLLNARAYVSREASGLAFVQSFPLSL